MATQPTGLAEWLDYQQRVHPRAIELGLERVREVWRRLGAPAAAPLVITVGGTNGKGSTVAFMRAMAEAQGLGVHAFTSPHLVRFAERIRLNGRLIEEDALAALLDRVEDANAGQPITFFEITTVAAFLAMSETPADWVLLEVGLGGRLDATNVLDRPRLSVITPVSIDHQQYLGETLAEIAGEKAGILKPGVPAVIGRQAPEALAVIDAAHTSADTEGIAPAYR